MSDDPLAAVVSQQIDRGAMPGATWWVGSSAEALRTGAAGSACLEPERAPATLDTPYDLASLTKPLATAVLLTMLEREGAVGLGSPLSLVLPELQRSPYGNATIREAATHRAGFPAWAPLYLSGRTREEYLAAVARIPPAGPAGATLYSDLGYILLGIAIERNAGRSLDALFEERVAGPLSLDRCGYPARGDRFRAAAATERTRAFERSLAGLDGKPDPGGWFDARVPRGQVHDGNAWGLGGVSGHAGLFATAADVAAIAAAILEPRRLALEDGAFAGMLSVDSGAGARRTIGFLRAADSDAVRGVLPDDAVGHAGFTGTSLWLDPAANRIYVLLTNRVHPVVPKEPFTAPRRAFHAEAVRRA